MNKKQIAIASFITTTIAVYFMWFVLPFYSIMYSLSGNLTPIAVIFTWFVGYGYSTNKFNQMEAFKKLAD